MSDGVPKSRVTLVYDTKQPEGREKPRELPFRLLVLGDVGGDKSAPLDQRKVRQLNGRNLGEVIKGLKIEVRDIDLGGAPVAGKPRPKAKVLIDSLSSFAPDDVLRLLTGQKASSASVDPMLAGAWGPDKAPKDLWPGDAALTKRWNEREQVSGFQKSYQNSKTLRAALKRFSAPPADAAEIQARKDAIAEMKKQIASALSAPPKPTT
jgi:hypothetical protein